MTEGPALKDKCDMLEKEKLDLLRKVESVEKDLEDFKLKHSKTNEMVQEISLLKTKLENYSLRFEKIAGYDSMRVNEILEAPLDDTNCSLALIQITASVVPLF